MTAPFSEDAGRTTRDGSNTSWPSGRVKEGAEEIDYTGGGRRWIRATTLAPLSHVGRREVLRDYTLRWDEKLYRIERWASTTGLRRAKVRVEQRLDGSMAVRHGERYLPVKECAVAGKPEAPPKKPTQSSRPRGQGSDWNKDFDLKKGPKVRQAAQASGYRGSTGE